MGKPYLPRYCSSSPLVLKRSAFASSLSHTTAAAVTASVSHLCGLVWGLCAMNFRQTSASSILNHECAFASHRCSRSQFNRNRAISRLHEFVSKAQDDCSHWPSASSCPSDSESSLLQPAPIDAPSAAASPQRGTPTSLELILDRQIKPDSVKLSDHRTLSPGRTRHKESA